MDNTGSPILQEVAAKAREIHTDSYPMSIGELISIYRDDEMDIHPEFQRFFRWSLLQKSKFVESILLGIPIPSIFVSQRDDGVWDVVDGVQRLSTIFEFVGVLKNEKGKAVPASELIGTEYLPALEGMVWQDDTNPEHAFPESLRIDFKRAKLDLQILKRESDEDTKYDLFQRLNTLGSRLSDQEVRNCLLVMLRREMYEWLSKLSEYEPFREAISLTDRALEERYDMELALRFVILTRILEKEAQGVKDIDAFITTQMRQLAQDESFDFEIEARIFKKTFKALFDVCDGPCFTRQDEGRGRGGFLISVFEVAAAGLGWAVRKSPDRAIDTTALKTAYGSVAANAVFRKYSGSGRSASSRMPRLVPLGRKLFGSV